MPTKEHSQTDVNLIEAERSNPRGHAVTSYIVQDSFALYHYKIRDIKT